jgi:hypothetical protein
VTHDTAIGVRDDRGRGRSNGRARVQQVERPAASNTAPRDQSNVDVPPNIGVAGEVGAYASASFAPASSAEA